MKCEKTKLSREEEEAKMQYKGNRHLSWIWDVFTAATIVIVYEPFLRMITIVAGIYNLQLQNILVVKDLEDLGNTSIMDILRTILKWWSKSKG